MEQKTDLIHCHLLSIYWKCTLQKTKRFVFSGWCWPRTKYSLHIRFLISNHYLGADSIYNVFTQTFLLISAHLLKQFFVVILENIE